MEFLHESQIIHGDLAARNILMGQENIKIADFGNACFKPLKKDWGWAAPEQLREGLFTYKSDVWSFGVVAWEMSTFGKFIKTYFTFYL